MREQLERPGTASRTITTAVWGWKRMRSVINSSVDRIQIESLPANQVIVAPTVFLPPLLLHLENPLALNKCFTLAGLASVYLYAVLRHRCCTLLIYFPRQVLRKVQSHRFHMVAGTMLGYTYYS